jgi:hypothetical protein
VISIIGQVVTQLTVAFILVVTQFRPGRSCIRRERYR